MQVWLRSLVLYFCLAGVAWPASTLVLTRDPALQEKLVAALQKPRFKKLVSERRLSVALADLSSPVELRYAAIDDDRMRYAASLPKIAILLAVFDRIEKGELVRDAALTRKMEAMVRRSNNKASSELIELVGFEAIASVLQDPAYELYDEDRNGGLWVGKGYGNIGYWKRDPMHELSHGATARQVARFLIMLERGRLVSPEASAEMKRILGQPAIRHKFVRGLSRFAGALVFRKSGTWRQFHSDAALVERRGKKYVAVALLESDEAQGVLSSLIVDLDGLIGEAAPVVPPSGRE